MKYFETRQDITAAVKEQTDIVKVIGEHVELKRSGVRYLGLCPFHGEKTPSFSVQADQQFFHCFGCGESGDVFSFMMKYHNLDFPSSLKQLADRCNIELPKKQVSQEDKRKEEQRRIMYEVTQKASAVYRKYLQSAQQADAARQYLQERGIPEKVLESFGVGYAPSKDIAGWDFLGKQLSTEEAVVAEQVGLLVKNERGGRYDRFRDRILFPIYDVQGRVNGFGGRIVGEGQPKYMNSPESPIFNKSRTLLGLFQQSKEIRTRRQAVIVEGNFDLVSLVVHGCTNVVAPLGTALTAAQIRILGKYAQEAILLFDGDEAGVKAALRAAPHFLAEQMNAKVALLPMGHDPDTFVREKGLGELTALLGKAEELPEFVLNQLIKEHGLSLEGKSGIVEELRPLVAAAASPLQRSVVISHFGEKLGIPPNQLEASLKNEKRVTAGRPPEAAIKEQAAPQKFEPLSLEEKRILKIMVMNPTGFALLEGAGVRECLEGGMGEVVFLQMKMMLQEGGEVQPEEVLSAFADGPERSLVADMLLNASQLESIQEEDGEKSTEFSALLELLELKKMRRYSSEIDGKIKEALQDGDLSALAELLEEKEVVKDEMRRLRD
jgi:DNA primase